MRRIDELLDDQENAIFDQTEVLRYHPPHISPRIPVQHSVFTLHPYPDKDFQHESLVKWVIPQHACWDIKRSLNASGITPASLFPGIDGLSEHIAWLYKWSYFDRERTPTAR